MDTFNNLLKNVVNFFQVMYSNILFEIDYWYKENKKKSPQRVILDHLKFIIPFLNLILLFYLFFTFFKNEEIEVENKLCTGHQSIHLERNIIQDLPIGYTEI